MPIAIVKYLRITIGRSRGKQLDANSAELVIVAKLRGALYQAVEVCGLNKEVVRKFVRYESVSP